MNHTVPRTPQVVNRANSGSTPSTSDQAETNSHIVMPAALGHCNLHTLYQGFLHTLYTLSTRTLSHVAYIAHISCSLYSPYHSTLSLM